MNNCFPKHNQLAWHRHCKFDFWMALIAFWKRALQIVISWKGGWPLRTCGVYRCVRRHSRDVWAAPGTGWWRPSTGCAWWPPALQVWSARADVRSAPSQQDGGLTAPPSRTTCRGKRSGFKVCSILKGVKPNKPYCVHIRVSLSFTFEFWTDSVLF